MPMFEPKFKDTPILDAVDDEVANIRGLIEEMEQLLHELNDGFDGLNDRTTQIISSVGTNPENADLRQRLSDLKLGHKDEITEIQVSLDKLRLRQSHYVANIRKEERLRKKAETLELQRLKEAEEQRLKAEKERLRKEAMELQHLKEVEEQRIKVKKEEEERKEASRIKCYVGEPERSRKAELEALERQRLKENEEAKRRANLEEAAKAARLEKEQKRKVELQRLKEEERKESLRKEAEAQRLKEEEAEAELKAMRKAKLEAAARLEKEQNRKVAEALELQRLKEEEEQRLKLPSEDWFRVGLPG